MVLGVIPARFGSTRFPGKALVSLHGRPLIEHVHRRASRIRGLDELLVATDDERIAEAVRRFGGRVELTRADHSTGTDRIGEVVARRAVADGAPDIVVNLQGDEPLLPFESVSELLAQMKASLAEGDAGLRGAAMAIWTLAAPIEDPAELARPSVVKVARAHDGRALYFSRAPIPHGAVAMQDRDRERDSIRVRDVSDVALRHIGIYAFTRAALTRFLSLPPSPLERLEKLEQLRALEGEIPIQVVLSTAGSPGVDTPDDLDRLLERYPTADAFEAAKE